MLKSAQPPRFIFPYNLWSVIIFPAKLPTGLNSAGNCIQTNINRKIRKKQYDFLHNHVVKPVLAKLSAPKNKFLIVFVFFGLFFVFLHKNFSKNIIFSSIFH